MRNGASFSTHPQIVKVCTYAHLDLIQPCEENENYNICREMSITGDHCVKHGKPDSERKITSNLGFLEEQKMLLTAGSAPATFLACLFYVFIFEVVSQLHSSG